MITPTKRAMRRLAASLAIITAFATSGAWAAGFWKGTGQDSATTGNWTNSRVFMNGDYFYVRDSKMTGTDYRRYMRLTADVTNTNGQGILFQCGTEDDPFVVADDGNNRTITLKYKNGDNPGNIYIGHSKNTDNATATPAGYYGSAVMNGGTWTCNQLLVGDIVDDATYTGYLRLNGASLTTTSTSENPCANGKIVVDAGELTFTKGMSVGKNGGTAELVINGGTMSCGGDLLLGSASGDNGTLTVNGGTITVSSGWTKGYSSKGTVNLNGGTLRTYHIHEQSGSTTVNFNGGTLQATKVYTQNGGLIHGNVAVSVGANGGVIDNGGYDVAIAPALGGTGGLTFTGGGTTTLNGNVNYSGATAVTPGTILAVANSSAKSNILSHGLVVVGVPTAPGQTVMTYTSALDDADLDKVSCPLAPTTTFKFSDETKTAIVVDEVGPTLDNYWTGAVDNDLSNDANWSSGSKPTGNANIFSTVPATLTKGDTFAPTSITFLAGSASVTIDGDDFTGIVAVTNLSVASHTINAKVHFTGNIQVKQNADHADHRTNSHIVFAGGAYAGAGYSIENGATVNWSHCMFGKYYFANTSDNRWTATEYSNCRLLVADNSSLYIPYAGSLKELDVGSGAKVDVGDIENTTGRLSHKNEGEMVVTNMTLSGKNDRYLTYNQGTSVPGVFKFDSITNSMSGNWFYLADEVVASKHTIYIGEGGLNFNNDSGTAAYCIGRDSANNAETIRPWYSDFTIGARSTDDPGLAFRRDVTFLTDDEKGVGRTITINAITRGVSNSNPAITVSGSGTLQVDKAARNDSGADPSVAVKDTATLKYSSGATFGSGTVTLDYGTTFAFVNTVSDLSEKPTIALSGEGEGNATFKIDGKRLRSGTNLELISSGAPEGCAARVTVTGEALGGRKYTLTEDNGKLYLSIESDGLMIIFR